MQSLPHIQLESIEVRRMFGIRLETQHRRSITVIQGIPFYLSSGDNSGFAQTWFPFLGLTPWGKSFFIQKPYSPNDVVFTHLIHFHFSKKHENLSRKLRELPMRFGDFQCLLLSCALGGGLWESHNGKALRKLLTSQFPAFFNSTPQYELGACEKCFTSADFQEANLWLRDRIEPTLQHAPNVTMPLNRFIDSLPPRPPRPLPTTLISRLHSFLLQRPYLGVLSLGSIATLLCLLLPISWTTFFITSLASTICIGLGLHLKNNRFALAPDRPFTNEQQAHYEQGIEASHQARVYLNSFRSLPTWRHWHHFDAGVKEGLARQPLLRP